MNWLVLSFGFTAACFLILLAWRRSDIRSDRRARGDLLNRAGPSGSIFSPSAVEGLPEPAQRYFRYAIAPGTPLVSVVEIEMRGQLGLGTKTETKYRQMTAREILAPPEGLIWRVRAGALSGSDGATADTSWTRFWLLHLIPVVRVSGDPDHHRSAFGRIVSEGAFWVPASLLPSETVSWEPIDEHAARATVFYGGYSQSVELTVEADGRPSRVVIQRWSNENAERVFREQPFGGYLSDFREFGGYRLPTRVEGGNWIGTEDYFPFFEAEVQAIHFPQLES